MKLIAAIAIALLAVPALAQDIRVINGDTFVLDGEIIRLWGIDAPELDQTCTAEDGREVEFGLIAAQTLAELLTSLNVCETMDTEQDGRTVAWCALDDGTDVAGQMVADGLAWDWLEYSGGHYRSAEVIAYRNQLGHWQFDCLPPWEWRRQ